MHRSQIQITQNNQQNIIDKLRSYRLFIILIFIGIVECTIFILLIMWHLIGFSSTSAPQQKAVIFQSFYCRDNYINQKQKYHMIKIKTAFIAICILLAFSILNITLAMKYFMAIKNNVFQNQQFVKRHRNNMIALKALALCVSVSILGILVLFGIYLQILIQSKSNKLSVQCRSIIRDQKIITIIVLSCTILILYLLIWIYLLSKIPKYNSIVYQGQLLQQKGKQHVKMNQLHKSVNKNSKELSKINQNIKDINKSNVVHITNENIKNILVREKQNQINPRKEIIILIDQTENNATHPKNHTIAPLRQNNYRKQNNRPIQKDNLLQENQNSKQQDNQDQIESNRRFLVYKPQQNEKPKQNLQIYSVYRTGLNKKETSNNQQLKKQNRQNSVQNELLQIQSVNKSIQRDNQYIRRNNVIENDSKADKNEYDYQNGILPFSSKKKSNNYNYMHQTGQNVPVSQPIKIINLESERNKLKQDHQERIQQNKLIKNSNNRNNSPNNGKDMQTFSIGSGSYTNQQKKHYQNLKQVGLQNRNQKNYNFMQYKPQNIQIIQSKQRDVQKNKRVKKVLHISKIPKYRQSKQIQNYPKIQKNQGNKLNSLNQVNQNNQLNNNDEGNKNNQINSVEQATLIMDLYDQQKIIQKNNQKFTN